jgi:hypothetical protein
MDQIPLASEVRSTLGNHTHAIIAEYIDFARRHGCTSVSISTMRPGLDIPDDKVESVFETLVPFLYKKGYTVRATVDTHSINGSHINISWETEIPSPPELKMCDYKLNSDGTVSFTCFSL